RPLGRTVLRAEPAPAVRGADSTRRARSRDPPPRSVRGQSRERPGGTPDGGRPLPACTRRGMKSHAWIGLLLVISVPLQAHAWGPEAHRAAAAIAAERLCRPTALELERLLGGQLLVEASTWPDHIRGESRWAHTRDRSKSVV